MNVMNLIENFNNKIVNRGNGFQGESEKAQTSLKADAVQPNRKYANAEETKKAVAELNMLSKNFNERVQFSVDNKTNKVIIKVMDRDTNEVISEIPGKYSIRLLEHIRENLGNFVDESR
ncbi:MAG: flagellar protein FlaG [Leptospirales bacterium]|nr:flagellar protein FlaG [Leptospirales bacterium]